MQARNFIINPTINTQRLVAVYDEQMGMIGYSNENSILDAFVYIKDHGYFVKISFFNMGYEEYFDAARYLELPVINNHDYNEYVKKLEYEYAVSMALKAAVTDDQLIALHRGRNLLDERFPGPTITSFENYDEVISNINCILRLCVQNTNNPLDVGTAFLHDAEGYNRPLHHAMKVIIDRDRRKHY